MKKLFIILACLICATAAFAADKKPIADNDLGITDKDCQALVDYLPSADEDY